MAFNYCTHGSEKRALELSTQPLHYTLSLSSIAINVRDHVLAAAERVLAITQCRAQCEGGGLIARVTMFILGACATYSAEVLLLLRPVGRSDMCACFECTRP